MQRRIAERGEGNLGCILWVVALGIAVLIAVKMVPVKIASATLYDYMDKDMATHAAEAPPHAIAKAILTAAKQLELPLGRNDVHVESVRDNTSMRAAFT